MECTKKMPNLRAYIANCLIGGNSITENEKSWLSDTVEFHCGGQVFVLKQKASVIKGNRSDFKGNFCETSEILVRNVDAKDVKKTLAAINRICWLLSFAELSRVLCYGHDYPDGSSLSARHSAIGTVNSLHPTLETQDGEAVKSFVEQTYPAFTLLAKSRKLSAVIDYLLQAELENQPLECRLLLIFTILENLKRTYAHQKSIPYLKGFFRKDARNNGPTYGFEELLHMMFREVKMRRGLKRIVKLRNEIIHSGLSCKSYRQQRAMYGKVHDLLREYILRLLGFRGSYLIYSSGSNSLGYIA